MHFYSGIYNVVMGVAVVMKHVPSYTQPAYKQVSQQDSFITVMCSIFYKS
jgi:hypothetical protein